MYFVDHLNKHVSDLFAMYFVGHLEKRHNSDLFAMYLVGHLDKDTIQIYLQCILWVS